MPDQSNGMVARRQLLAELVRAQALFQARAIAAVMGLPQPTSIDAALSPSLLDDDGGGK